MKISEISFVPSNEINQALTRRSANWVRALAMTALVLAYCLGASTNAIAIVPNCSTVTNVFASCGWVITAPGCYKLLNSLTASTDAGDCIQINSSNVYLDLNTQTITGTGATSTGNGVHVLTQTIPGAVAITNVAVQGGRSISGFDFGVYVGTPSTATGPSKVRLDNVTSVNNNFADFYLDRAKYSQLSGLSGTGAPTGTGLFIAGGSGNRVSNSSFTGNDAGVAIGYHSVGNILSAVNASFNIGYGLSIFQSTGNQISAPSVDSNGSGISLYDAANGNNIAGGHVNSNRAIGIWLSQSSANEVSGIEVNQNGAVGIYLGCDGPTSGTCTTGFAGVPMSNGNGIDANTNITSTLNAGSAFGIVIDKGNLANTVVGNASSANATFDEYDGNKCGLDIWFADSFGTSSASCVH